MDASRIAVFGVFFVGIVLALAGVALGFPGSGAWEKTYEYEGLQQEVDQRNVVQYSDLPPSQQAIVDRAVRGERVVVSAFTDLPPTVVATRAEGYHVFAKQTRFALEDPQAQVSLVLFVTGVLGVWTAIKRRHGR